MVQGLFEDENAEQGGWPDEKRGEEEFVVASNYRPQPAAETIRQSGLAYSAGIALFVTIVFMLFLGWLADQLLGSSPWGIVGGIVLGSIVGFLQFFRITSQIFVKNNNAPAEHPLMSPTESADPADRGDQKR